MALIDDIEEFRTLLSRVVEQLDEVNTTSVQLPGFAADELSRKFTDLSESLEESVQELRNGIELIEDIRSRWG